MVTVNNLNITINNQTILNNVSCTLVPGKITLFIGKSGAGKTTILKSLAGLQSINSGTILLDNKELKLLGYKERSEEVGYVFQEFNLFNHMTALHNCIDPLIVHGLSYEQAKKRALELLETLGMANFIDNYPAQLSGGQQQRVAIARALCLQPKVLLLDEPTASLDPLNTKILTTLLQKLAAQGLTIGVSSQDMNFVRNIFDRIYYVDSGKIIEYCDNKTIPLNRFPAIAHFIGDSHD